jgi:DNA-binding NarL/FixJ family response regulator
MSYWPLVLVADSSPTDVQIISEVLNSEYRFNIARNGVDALAFAARNPLPDLVLLEVHLPDMNGFEVCRCLKQSPTTRNIPVIFVTSVHDDAQEARAMDLHAADYITKPYSVAVARARIRNRLLSHRELPIRDRGPGTEIIALPSTGSPGQDPGMGLGKRQTEVLSLIAAGLTSAEIADQLSIAKGTVEVHRENIMRKLGVRNIAGLVKCAIRHGLLHP